MALLRWSVILGIILGIVVTLIGFGYFLYPSVNPQPIAIPESGQCISIWIQENILLEKHPVELAFSFDYKTEGDEKFDYLKFEIGPC